MLFWGFFGGFFLFFFFKIPHVSVDYITSDILILLCLVFSELQFLNSIVVVGLQA